jgi:4'-phosphopantetheinyl transferase
MTVVYYTHFTRRLAPEDFTQAIHLLPPAIGVRIRRFRRWEDAHASLYGRLMLRKGLHDLGINRTLADIQYSPYQRPYFAGTPVDFSIAHSGNRVVCAISTEGPIGADIEEIKPLDIHTYQSQFQAAEWSAIISSPDVYRRFFGYWTQKEAAIKADGRGLAIPLSRVAIVKSMIFVEGTRYFSREIPVSDSCVCHIATRQPLRQIRIESNPLTAELPYGE